MLNLLCLCLFPPNIFFFHFLIRLVLSAFEVGKRSKNVNLKLKPICSSRAPYDWFLCCYSPGPSHLHALQPSFLHIFVLKLGASLKELNHKKENPTKWEYRLNIWLKLLKIEKFLLPNCNFFGERFYQKFFIFKSSRTP